MTGCLIPSICASNNRRASPPRLSLYVRDGNARARYEHRLRLSYELTSGILLDWMDTRWKHTRSEDFDTNLTLSLASPRSTRSRRDFGALEPSHPSATEAIKM